MKVFTFNITDDEDVIIVAASIEGKYKLKLALIPLQHIQPLTVMFFIFRVTN